MSNCIQTCSVVLRREWMPPLDEGFQGLKLGDWPLFVLLNQRGWIGYIDRNMAGYRLHADNVWNSRPADFKLPAMRQMAEYLMERVDEDARDAWQDTIIAIAFKDLALTVSSFSISKTWTKLVAFATQCSRFNKPLWVGTRLWAYVSATYLVGSEKRSARTP